MRAWLLLSALLIPTSASAQDKWEDHAAWWFAADVSLSPIGRYTRELSPASTTRSWGGSLAASAFYVGHGPFGVGAHVAPTLVALELPNISGSVLMVDVGFDPFARLSWEKVDLTFRIPLGLSTGHVNWVRTTDGLLRESNPKLGGGVINDDLGVGFHVGPQVGAVWWLGDYTGMRVESGLWYRRLSVDEGASRAFPGDVDLDTIAGEVVHNSLAWTLSIGVVRRLNPRSLPDDGGPPLPTPDYYQPTP
jgi:hypothetical protein